MASWWYSKLDEFSPLTIALTEWAPVTITIILGGLFASIIFPRWQDRYVSRRAVSERRLKIVEQVSELLSSYTTIWRRLIEISRHEVDLVKAGKEDEAVAKRKAEYVARRSEVHDELMACLARARIYFPDEQNKEISEFIEWAESLSTLRLDQLPEISTWRDWELKLVKQLGSP